MSLWKEDERADRQRYYGYYCNICRKQNLPIKPFCNFSIEDFRMIK